VSVRDADEEISGVGIGADNGTGGRRGTGGEEVLGHSGENYGADSKNKTSPDFLTKVFSHYSRIWLYLFCSRLVFRFE